MYFRKKWSWLLVRIMKQYRIVWLVFGVLWIALVILVAFLEKETYTKIIYHDC